MLAGGGGHVVRRWLVGGRLGGCAGWWWKEWLTFRVLAVVVVVAENGWKNGKDGECSHSAKSNLRRISHQSDSDGWELSP